MMYILLLPLVASLALADEGEVAVADSSFSMREVNYVMPWLRGPNMCAYYQIPGKSGISGRYYTECLLYKPKMIMGEQASIEYECCPGFKNGEGESGCVRVDPIEDILTTTQNMGLTSFPIQEAGLSRTLTKDGAYTFFVPTNEAIEEATDRDGSIGGRLKDRQMSLIKYHMMKGRLYIYDIKGGQKVEMEYMRNGKKEVAIIQKYCNGVATINGARIILQNREADNGVVHVIDKVIEPISESRMTVMLALQSDSRYSEFLKYVEQVPGLGDTLDGGGEFTILAPTNDAFARLDTDILDRLKDKTTVEAFVKGHIIPKTIATASVLEPLSFTALNDERLKITIDEEGTLVFNGQAKITTGDQASRNGIIHVIDDVIKPDFILGGSALAEKLELRTYLGYIRRAGLESLINGREKRTLFIPSEKAWMSLSADTKARIQSDPEYLTLLLKYHMVNGEYKLSDMNSQAQFTSEANGATLSLNRYREFGSQTGFTIQGAKISGADYRGGDVMINVISKVLLPPHTSILNFLETDERFSVLYSMIVQARVDSIIRSLKGKMTFILPTNAAFEELESDFADELKNRRHLAKVLRYHIWPKALYTSSFTKGWTYYVRTHLGEDIEVHREKEELLLNHRVHVEKPDISMTDGSVIHIVDEVLRCRCPFRG